MKYAYLLSALWTLVALVWRDEGTAGICLSVLAGAHWLGVMGWTCISYLERGRLP
jgi:hypothetical protein